MSNIITIRPVDAAYPERVRSAMKPPVLYAVGNLDLLELDGFGVCGSRDASGAALEWAFDFGWQVAEGGGTLVSGYARGIDRQAHKGALEAGGSTIAVLPEGIDGFRVVKELRPLVDFGENFLAVSMFAPKAAWQAWQAMERNKLIVALSLELWVVEARERGGTFNAALECARQRKPLKAVDSQGEGIGREGNKRLLETMAVPVQHPSEVRDALQRAANRRAADTRQMAMALG